MVTEITAAIQSIQVLGDLLKANRSLSNFNELVAAVSEVSAKLSTAWKVALDSQETQATLSQRIGELEKEMTALKDWNGEAQHYQLAAVGTGVFAYRPKPGMKQDEPAHVLCAHCFQERAKSLLQVSSRGSRYDTYSCPRCKNEIHSLHPHQKTPRTNNPNDWTQY